MKVVLINGSPHKDGCTIRALEEIIITLNKEGIETEFFNIGAESVRGCLACGKCHELNRCIFDNDSVNKVAKAFESADGLIVGSPVYFASPNGSLISFLDRLFYSTRFSKHMKVGASVVSCRRGGNASSFDVLNKYFLIRGMPVVPSTYWNMVYGHTKEDIEKDLEGLQTMRNLARNMAFMIKAINKEKEVNGLPKEERDYFTSFPDGK